ncbi:uncharacterized protein LOC135196211 [Macrobrachium nipponense]|uniref:uncharacterized protein LOC135196211 n=1 Tax=Macrobrachium nipponense TaxID=159736 RepID=UPI0030C82FFE
MTGSMCPLPKAFFCWSLKSGTLLQGVISPVTVCINILSVALGLSDLIDARIYLFCFPSETCYDKLRAIEMSLVLTNIVVNALYVILSPLLIIAIKKGRPSLMFPFMFIQGLMISGLAAAAVAAFVICIAAGSWVEYVPLLICSGLYLALHVYLAVVVHAYQSEAKEESAIEKSHGRQNTVSSLKEREATIEDYVF